MANAICLEHRPISTTANSMHRREILAEQFAVAGQQYPCLTHGWLTPLDGHSSQDLEETTECLFRMSVQITNWDAHEWNGLGYRTWRKPRHGQFLAWSPGFDISHDGFACLNRFRELAAAALQIVSPDWLPMDYRPQHLPEQLANFTITQALAELDDPSTTHSPIATERLSRSDFADLSPPEFRWSLIVHEILRTRPVNAFDLEMRSLGNLCIDSARALSEILSAKAIRLTPSEREILVTLSKSADPPDQEILAEDAAVKYDYVRKLTPKLQKAGLIEHKFGGFTITARGRRALR